MALVEDMPQARLSRGQVGTVVEVVAPSVFEVEFCDNDGRTYAMETLREDQLLVLRYQPDGRLHHARQRGLWSWHVVTLNGLFVECGFG